MLCGATVQAARPPCRSHHCCTRGILASAMQGLAVGVPQCLHDKGATVSPVRMSCSAIVQTMAAISCRCIYVYHTCIHACIHIYINTLTTSTTRKLAGAAGQAGWHHSGSCSSAATLRPRSSRASSPQKNIYRGLQARAHHHVDRGTICPRQTGLESWRIP